MVRRNTNRRHMTGDHHGWTAGRATPLVRAADEILGTHKMSVADIGGHRRSVGPGARSSVTIGSSAVT
jgi:hypothetical protein